MARGGGRPAAGGELSPARFGLEVVIPQGRRRLQWRWARAQSPCRRSHQRRRLQLPLTPLRCSQARAREAAHHGFVLGGTVVSHMRAPPWVDISRAQASKVDAVAGTGAEADECGDISSRSVHGCGRSPRSAPTGYPFSSVFLIAPLRLHRGQLPRLRRCPRSCVRAQRHRRYLL